MQSFSVGFSLCEQRDTHVHNHFTYIERTIYVNQLSKFRTAKFSNKILLPAWPHWQQVVQLD